MDARARIPDRTGFAEHDGHNIYYEVFGSGEPTIVLIHGIPLIHSRIWRGVIPMLARQHRVVSFDLLGNGRSDRPTDPGAYALSTTLGCLQAVLRATRTTQRILIGQSLGALVAMMDAAGHSEAVAGVVLLAPSVPVAAPPTGWAGLDLTHFDDPPTAGSRWAAVHRTSLAADYDAFARSFIDQTLPEAHTSVIGEDCLSYARQTNGQVLAACFDGLGVTSGTWADRVERTRPLCRAVRCPALVVHGTADAIAPVQTAELLADLLHADLLLIENGGHTLAKAPVQVNLAIRAFIDRVAPRRQARQWTNAASRQPRVLYLSSPIGLGHVHRDIAIATALRNLRPDLQVDWLAQDPVSRVLRERHESVHPASDYLASELTAFEQDCDQHGLNAFQAFRHTDDVQLANFHIFADLLADGGYDAVIADEAWEVDALLHDNPELKRAPFIWLTDFVGILPAAGTPDSDRALIADANAEMLEQRARYPWLRDLSLYVGNPADLVDDPLGPGLPTISEWTSANFAFTGYILGTPPFTAGARDHLRATLGYHPDEKICIVTAGGSNTGIELLRQAAKSYPLMHRQQPELKMLIVAGPRIDPDDICAPDGVDVRGYLPHLAGHLASCDVAIVQGGLSTSMELTANHTPFIYVPLQRHFEQQIHVPKRLDNYHSGHRIDWPDLTPDHLAVTVPDLTQHRSNNRPVETDGAERAATAIAELLP